MLRPHRKNKMPSIFDLYKNAYRYGLGLGRGTGVGGEGSGPLKPIPEDSSYRSKPSSSNSIGTSSLSSSAESRLRQELPESPSTILRPVVPVALSTSSSSSSIASVILPNSTNGYVDDELNWQRDLERERDRRALIRAAKRAQQLTDKVKQKVEASAPFKYTDNTPTLPSLGKSKPTTVNGIGNSLGLGLGTVKVNSNSNGVVSSLQSTSGHSSTSDYSSLEEEQVTTTTNPSTMNYSSELSLSEEYQSFRSSVPLRKVAVDSNNQNKTWKIYDAGPKGIRTPLICLAPVSGTADIFYKQILSLSSRGIRVIAAENPVYWSVNEWCEGFKRLLDHLDIDKVHLFGASLGGFLAQKFAEYTFQYSRVASLILCNSFTDTSIFNLNESALVFWMLPAVVLKKMVIGNLSSDRKDKSIASAIDFMTERLEALSQQEIASRLTINCVNSLVDSFKLRNVKITLVDVFDDSALTSSTREDIYKHYPHAKTAHLKTGGNFPYLSKSDEVNMHVLVHLRAFVNTRLSAFETKQSQQQHRKAMLRRKGQPPMPIANGGIMSRSSTGLLDEDEYDFVGEQDGEGEEEEDEEDTERPLDVAKTIKS